MNSVGKFYSGTLYFKNDDQLIFSRLIRRENEIVFDCVTTWDGDSEKWDISGRASKTNNVFKADNLNMISCIGKVKDTTPFSITFQIISSENQYIEVAGNMRYREKEYPFDGVLEQIQ